MNKYWFTDSEREAICANPQCEEHGNGTENCDIPAQQPDKGFSQSSSVLGLSNAKPLQPTVEVVREGEDK